MYELCLLLLWVVCVIEAVNNIIKSSACKNNTPSATYDYVHDLSPGPWFPDARCAGSWVLCPAHTHTQYQDYVLLIWAVTRIIVLNFGVSPPSKRKLLVFNRIVIASGHVLINCTRAGVYACERG